MKNGMPEFAEVAKAYGLFGEKANTLEELNKIVERSKDQETALIIDVNVIYFFKIFNYLII